ncbi:MAG: VIT1/CCC1 transporter family protein [Anaerolineaceae bacterium]|jgi:VIT1/CCC1 family predicted Fe2+/Mn2+ transporter|nr:VIT1/CCC1 transporter family protein [Anaerolineaceae bacterium]MDD4043690.1 VIT1/CCC1 transporter family protein [Anaerolineaceae bacterium]MDD4578063.1 VIT1/CCC1 transporter family protein [Anaerolineaceae bacterium]
MIDEKTLAAIKEFQQDEINDHVIYTQIAANLKDEEDAKKVRKLAQDEAIHTQFWEEYTGVSAKPQRFFTGLFGFMSKVLGYTFVIKLLENREEKTINAYKKLEGVIPGVERLIQDEQEHEASLIAMLDEPHLQYSGSIVLGLNDALVELSGTLAGLTLAFQNTHMIALSGLVTGIAAALSMAASEYLSTRTEENTSQEPLKAAVYTGIAYIVTVALLILPYLVFRDYFVALAVMMTTVFVIIAFFSFYMSVLRDEKFSKHFFSMAAISVGVALISFLFGSVIQKFIEI